MVSVESNGRYVFAHPFFGFKFDINPSWSILTQELLDKQIRARNPDSDASNIVLSLAQSEELGTSSLNVIDSKEHGNTAMEFLNERLRKAQSGTDEILDVEFTSGVALGQCEFETLSYVREAETKRYYYHYWATSKDGRLLLLFARYVSPNRLTQIERMLNGDG